MIAEATADARAEASVDAAPRRVSLVVVTIVLLLAGCTGGGQSARQWAEQVCSALAPWRTHIMALNTQAQQEMSTASTPQQARDSLVRLLEGGRAETEATRAAVAAAGVPDVDGGAEVANRFVAALAGARDAYARARDELQVLSTADAPRFYDGVVDVLERLGQAYASSAADITALDSVEVSAAFDEVAACQ